MKICAMCGKKLVNAMLPFKLVMGKDITIDACGRCFMLTKINDLLMQIKEQQDGRSERPRIQIPH